MLVSEIKKNMLKPVIYRDTRWILVEYIYWIDEKERKARHSVMLREEKQQIKLLSSADRRSGGYRKWIKTNY